MHRQMFCRTIALRTFLRNNVRKHVWHGNQNYQASNEIQWFGHYLRSIVVAVLMIIEMRQNT